MSVPPHIKIQHSSLTGRMTEDSKFSIPNVISKQYPPIVAATVCEIVYNSHPAIIGNLAPVEGEEIVDQMDAEQAMGWEQARGERPQEYFDAVSKANDILTSRVPLASLVSFIGRDALLGEMADFTWYHGTDWLVETRFGNFHWKDPDYGDGDNSFTLFEGGHREFADHVHVGVGRDHGRNLILNKCGPDITLNLPQLDN